MTLNISELAQAKLGAHVFARRESAEARKRLDDLRLCLQRHEESYWHIGDRASVPRRLAARPPGSARCIRLRAQPRLFDPQFALAHDHHALLMAVASHRPGACAGRWQAGLPRVRRAGELRSRKFQQPFDGRDAHRMSEGVKLLLGIQKQLQYGQELLAAVGEEFGDDLLAVIGIG